MKQPKYPNVFLNCTAPKYPNVFLNCTAHELTPEQRKAIPATWGADTEIREMRDLAPELFARLANVAPVSLLGRHKSDPTGLREHPANLDTLAGEFHAFLQRQCPGAMARWPDYRGEGGHLLVHLPIGPPVLMHKIAVGFHEANPLVHPSYVSVYSQTARESIEEAQPDGSVVKRSVFRFKGFVYG